MDIIHIITLAAPAAILCAACAGIFFCDRALQRARERAAWDVNIAEQRARLARNWKARHTSARAEYECEAALNQLEILRRWGAH